MKNQNDTVEIDVLYLLKILWRRKFIIVMFAIFTIMLALLYSLFIAKPVYDSTTRIYVVSRQQTDNGTLTNQDLQAGSYLVKDYKEIILSQDVLNQVVSDLNLDQSASSLKSAVTVSVPTDTRILSITVSDNDPAKASQIANELRQVAAEKIIAVTKVSDVTTLEEASVPATPSSPNIKRNAVIAFLAGGVVSVTTILVIEMLDTRIKRPEDIEEAMGLVLLGVVPDLNKLK